MSKIIKGFKALPPSLKVVFCVVLAMVFLPVTWVAFGGERDMSSIEIASESEKSLEVTDSNLSYNFAKSEIDIEEILEDTDNEEENIDAFRVVRIVDGDTLYIATDEGDLPLRLIGINAPETNECLYSEATAFARQLAGEYVYVGQDESQDSQDRYGRYLVYVKTLDGKDFGEEMISEGFAKEYTFGSAYQMQTYYMIAERYAASNGLGVWSDKCVKPAGVVAEAKNPAEVNVNKVEPETTPTSKTSPTPKPAPKPTPPPEPELPKHNGKLTIEECEGILEEGLSAPIKGNSENKNGEKIYHIPGRGSYSRTKIDGKKGAFYFCSEADAVAAGWRRANNIGGASSQNNTSSENKENNIHNS